MKEESRKLWEAIGWKSPQERTQIRKEIAKEIEPLLISQGFVKIRTGFFRIYGDYLLQGIVVTCPDRVWVPAIELMVNPMYDSILDPILSPHHPAWNVLSSLRSGSEMGPTVEDYLGKRVNPLYNSYLADMSVLSEGIEKERKMLTEYILPQMNAMHSPEEALLFWTRGLYGRSLDEVKLLTVAQPFLLRNHQYADVIRFFQSEIEGNNELIRSRPPEFRRFYMPEKEIESYVQRRKDENAIYQKCIAFLQGDCTDIVNEEIEKAIRLGYEKIAQFSKTLVKKYPLEK